MKRAVIYFLWTFLCLHTTVSFSQAASSEDDIDAILASIDALVATSGDTGIDSDDTDEGSLSESLGTDEENLKLDAAPEIYITNTPVVYSSWELIHRTMMLQGFAWTGSIANFITPAMYIGTPIQTNMNLLGYDTGMGPTNYSECIRYEMDSSFGPDQNLIEDTVEDELRSIAKYCAVEYLGTYFEGKDYTTREEVLTMLFTLFEEEVGMPGYFDGGEFVSDGREVETPYSNVSPRSWYAPYITLAYEYLMVEDENTWKIAKEVTDEDIELMFSMYLVDADGETIDTVETRYGTYTIWYDDGLSIEKTHDMTLNSAPTESESSEDTPMSDEDILAELFGEE